MTDMPPPSTPPEAQPRLGALDDRRRNIRFSPNDRAHSAYVTRLRRILPVVALAIVAILMIWPRIRLELAERRFAPSTVDQAALQKAATENRLLQANFASVDSKGRPFTITATEALQATGNADSVTLQNPRGTLKISDTVEMTAQSREGFYAQEAQHLTLVDNVTITRSDGTTLNTAKLFVNLKTNDSSTDQPITVDGPQGHLTAQGMDMKNGGEVTIFNGPAKLIMNPKKSSGGNT